MSKWIKTQDKLPQDFISVLFYVPSEEPLQTVLEGYCVSAGGNSKWFTRFGIFSGKKVTHWRELPEPPTEME